MMCFLGMVGYYRKVCKNLSLVAKPLTHLLRKDQTYAWDNKCAKAFKKTKGLFVSLSVLMTLQFNKHFILMVDANNIGSCAALMQKDHKDLEHPIAYFH